MITPHGWKNLSGIPVQYEEGTKKITAVRLPPEIIRFIADVAVQNYPVFIYNAYPDQCPREYIGFDFEEIREDTKDPNGRMLGGRIWELWKH